MRLDIFVIVIQRESNLLNLARFNGKQELSDLMEHFKLFNVQENGTP